MYVVKRQGVYQFRKPVPNSLQPLFGRGDVRVSLRTTQASVAHRRALEMLVHVDEIFHLLRSDRPVDESRRLVVSMLEHAVTTVQGTPGMVHRNLMALNKTIGELKAHQDRAAETGSVFSSDDINRLEDVVSRAVQDGHQARFSEVPLSSAIEAYKQKIAPQHNGKHGADVPVRLDFFLSVVGDMPSRDLRRHHMEAFRDLLDKLPEKWQQRFGGADAATAIALNAKRLEPFDLLSPVTINLKYIGPVRRFLDELVQSEKIERNPAAGLESARTKNQQHKTAPNQKRLPFKIDQLNCILLAASKRPKTRAVYWTPPGMLLTGARLNEFCQLWTNDLVVHNDRPHLSILCLEEEDEDETKRSNKKQEPKRRVKSPAGRRLIPVHPTLIELGFLDFIESRRGRDGSHRQLFRELNPDKNGYYSGAVSKALNRLIKNAKAASPLRSVYSFRHNFSDACDAAPMPEKVKNKLIGHQLQGAPGV